MLEIGWHPHLSLRRPDRPWDHPELPRHHHKYLKVNYTFWVELWWFIVVGIVHPLLIKFLPLLRRRRRQIVSEAINCWLVYRMPPSPQSLQRQRRILRKNLRQANSNSNQSAHEQEFGNKRGCAWDFVYYFGPQNIPKSKNSLTEEMYWEIDWPDRRRLPNPKWRKNLEICCIDAGEFEFGAE